MKKKHLHIILVGLAAGILVMTVPSGPVNASSVEFSAGEDGSNAFSDNVTNVSETADGTVADTYVTSEQKEQEKEEPEAEQVPDESNMDVRQYWDDTDSSENGVAVQAGGMTTGSAGYSLIKQFESCHLTAYKAVSTEKYYTIGWGHYGADVYKGMTITQEQADRYLEQDVAGAQNAVNTFLNSNGITIGQNQFDALVSFTYNCGNVWVSTPTFQLKTILKNGYQNYSESQIRTAFTNWNKSGGQVLNGLTRRRNAEADLFLSSADIKEDVNIVMSTWFSATGMGDATGRCNNGDAVYLCYRLYDSNSGKNWDEVESKSYSVKETIYNPDGSERFSYTYNNDNNWIRMVPDKGGTYKGKIELTGDRTGTVECSISVVERNDVFGGWLTSDAAGKNMISTAKKGQRVYFWYNIHDSNTGELLNQYRNWTYTLQQNVYKPDGGKLLERTYNNADNGVLDFTADSAGKYKCETILTLSGGATTVNTKWLQVEKEEITANLTASPSGSAVSGSKVKLTAGASGGSGNYTYKFLVCDAKGNWYRLQDFGKSNTYTWTPGATGKKMLYVDVKDSEGTVKRASIAFEVKNKPLSSSLAANPSGSAVSGSQVKLTAGASGGSGNYTYKFLVCDAKGNWYRLRDFGKSNTYTWTPGATGKKTLYVDVRDSSGNIKRAAMSYEIKNKNNLAVTFTARPGQSAASGSNVLLMAKASGGSGKYTYKFLICDARGNWYKLQDYSTDNACIWTPGATGKKTLYVDVKDSAGQYIRKALSFTVTEKTKSMALESEEAVAIGEIVEEDMFSDGVGAEIKNDAMEDVVAAEKETETEEIETENIDAEEATVFSDQ